MEVKKETTKATMTGIKGKTSTPETAKCIRDLSECNTKNPWSDGYGKHRGRGKSGRNNCCI